MLWKAAVVPQERKKNVTRTRIELKRKSIVRLENGVHVSDLLPIHHSKVQDLNLLKNKEAIKVVNVAKCVIPFILFIPSR